MVEEDLSGADEGPRRPMEGSSEPIISPRSRTLRHTRVDKGEEDESDAGHTRYATIILGSSLPHCYAPLMAPHPHCDRGCEGEPETS